jgi:hypothetical protein
VKTIGNVIRSSGQDQWKKKAQPTAPHGCDSL